MTNSRNKPSAGYRLERVYVTEQSYEQIPPEALREAESGEDRNIRFSWDWRPMGPRRFEVAIEVEIEPVKQAPDRAEVRVVGIFEAAGPSARLSFVDFVRSNAPAILLPYAREVLSTMTGRGPNGAFHLNPVNIAALLGNADFGQTTGAKYLAAHPEIAESFGLEYRVAQPAQATEA